MSDRHQLFLIKFLHTRKKKLLQISAKQSSQWIYAELTASHDLLRVGSHSLTLMLSDDCEYDSGPFSRLLLLLLDDFAS